MERNEKLEKLKKEYKRVVSTHDIVCDFIDLPYIGGFFIAIAGLAAAGLSFLYVPLALLMIYVSYKKGNRYMKTACEINNLKEFAESANTQYTRIVWVLYGLMYYGLYMLPVNETAHKVIVSTYLMISMITVIILCKCVRGISYRKLYIAKVDAQYIGYIMLFCVDATLYHKGDMAKLMMLLGIILGLSTLINWLFLKSNGVVNVLYVGIITSPLVSWLVYDKKVNGYNLIAMGVIIHLMSLFMASILLPMLYKKKYKLLEEIGEAKNESDK